MGLLHRKFAYTRLNWDYVSYVPSTLHQHQHHHMMMLMMMREEADEDDDDTGGGGNDDGDNDTGWFSRCGIQGGPRNSKRRGVGWSSHLSPNVPPKKNPEQCPPTKQCPGNRPPPFLCEITCALFAGGKGFTL